tara:strand:+ start:203 stop:1165 length:963 start_codon:yes stop_codon:yes gene_type:complete
MIVNCILCKESTNFLDNYKFHVNSDIDFFGQIKIFYCEKCDLAFADPMPSRSKLDFFYENIYRDVGRPQYKNLELLEESLKSQKNYDYIEYLTESLNFNKIQNIFDFGSGSGDIGFLLSKKFNHLKLHTIETDNFSQEILKKRNYKIYKDFSEIQTKFDLIISTHTLEHLTNLDIIENFKKILKKNHYMFFEVPNNLFRINFLKRPYDSPHLIFFSKRSFEIIEKEFKLKIFNLGFASYSIEESFKYMQKSKETYQYWSKENKLSNIQFTKKLIKSILPNFIITLWRKFKIKSILQNKNFLNNNENSWCIRVIYENLEDS